MREFDRQLIRLKDALGVTEDQEVAKALGLSKAAFSDRKKRGVFPDDKLFTLSMKHPELSIDVYFVLTGSPSPADRVGEQLQAAAKFQAGAPVTDGSEQVASLLAKAMVDHAALRASRKEKMSELNALLDGCSDEDFELIMMTAARFYRAALSK